MTRKAQGSTGALLGGALIAAAAAAAYGRSFHVPFVYDDAGSIVNNPSLRSLSLWSVLKPLPGGMPVSGRPVLNLSFALNYALSGLNVWSYHALNLAIHILAGMTLFGIVRRFWPAWLALMIALIWTLHPLQTESVVYLSQRAESLMGLFYLLTLYGFVRAVEAPGENRFLVLSVIFCLLGMATKEVMVSAPLVVFLYDRTFVAGTFRDAWRRRRGYYLALASTWLVLLGLVGATGSRGGTAGFGLAVTPWAYALIQCQAVVHYLRLAVWPHPLVFYYGRPGGTAAVGFDTAFLLLLLIGSFYLLRRPERTPPDGSAGRGLGFLGACFLIVLAPSSSVVPVGTEMIAEHRMYLSLAAAVVALVGGLWILIARLAGARSLIFCICLFGAAAAGLGFMTDRRIADYRSDLALWTDTAAKAPGNATVRANLGSALLRAGDPAAAAREGREAVRLNPDSARAHSGLADALAQTGDLPGAVGHYEAAVRLNPGLFEARNNLGVALAQSGRLPEALAQLQAAVRLAPDFFDAHNNLALVLAKGGDLAGAEREFSAAQRLRPDDAGVRGRLQRVRQLLQNR